MEKQPDLPEPNVSRRRSIVYTVSGMAGFVIAALITNTVLTHTMPDNHDLSDIGTGLIRLISDGLAGAGVAVGLLVTKIIVISSRRH